MCNDFALDAIFFNCIQFHFTGDHLIMLFLHLTKNMHLIIGKYAYNNGYIDFSTNLTKSKSAVCNLSTVTQWFVPYIMAHQYSHAWNLTTLMNQPSVSDWVVQVSLWSSGLGMGSGASDPGIDPCTVHCTGGSGNPGSPEWKLPALVESG